MVPVKVTVDVTDVTPGEVTLTSGTACWVASVAAAGSAVLNVFAYFADDASSEPRYSAPYDYAFIVAN